MRLRSTIRDLLWLTVIAAGIAVAVGAMKKDGPDMLQFCLGLAIVAVGLNCHAVRE